MQKILTFFLVICLVFSLTACTKVSQEEMQTQPIIDTTDNVSQQTTAGVPEQTTPEQTVPKETNGETTVPGSEETTVPSIEETKIPEENGEQEATTPTEKPTEPAPETTHPAKPEDAPAEDNGCTHDYRFASAKSATCTADGYRRYTCNLCANVYRQILPAKGHTYENATCATPKTCKVCKVTEGKALGHTYGADALCVRCGRKDPNDKGAANFTANIRSTKGDAISGVTVSLYIDGATAPAGSAVTNNKGAVSIPISKQGSAYRVVLSNVPAKYKAEESYTFSSLTVSINLVQQPVYDPLDHSNAMYKEGDKMVEFSATDVDGNTYALSQLLRQKKLVVLNFWYVSCEPCKKEFPYFNAMLETYGDDVALLAFDPYYSAGDIKKLRDEMNLSFPVFQDTLHMAEGFSVKTFPVTVIIDETGIIRKIHKDAYSSEAAFLREIAKYL